MKPPCHVVVPWVICPQWVPTPVQIRAASMFEAALHARQDSRDLEAIVRLATDLRMRGVWTQVLRNGRGRRAIESRESASAQLFRTAVHALWQKSRAFNRAEVDAMQQRFIRMRDAIFADLKETSWFAPEFEPLANAVDAYHRLAERLSQAIPEVVKKNAAANSQEKALVRILGFETCELFGSPQYGSIATIVSVALETEVTRDQVRDWLTA